MRAAARRSALADVFTGDAGIVIGTHALLEEQVQFADLGLVVIDEQHRFGVEQRDALRAKAADNRPHVLVMTATPIPRTVAMTVYGDLEISTLTELPAGRSPIATHVVPARRQAEVPRAGLGAGQRGGRRRPAGLRGLPAHRRRPGTPTTADDPDEDDFGDADDDRRRLPRGVGQRPAPAAGRAGRGRGAGRRPAGRAAPGRPARQAAPGGEGPGHARVLRGPLDVLVATTVIEVGVDVPNATVMVIMDAERYGVSQLHQLRGRVGRGARPGCACW